MSVSPRRGTPVDGDTKRCPQCRQTLAFSSHYPVLTVGMALVAPSVEPGERIRYTRAWVCRNGACDYRDIEETRTDEDALSPTGAARSDCRSHTQ